MAKIEITPLEQVKLNTYGNADTMPNGWVTTTANLQILKKLSIPTVKVFCGWNKSGRYYSPILTNAIPSDREKEVKEYLQNRELAKEKKFLVATANAEKIATRRAKQNTKLVEFIESHYSIPHDEIVALVEYGNQVGSGKVLRGLDLSIEKKVRIALVAWARHQHTTYELELSTELDSIYQDYVDGSYANSEEKHEAFKEMQAAQEKARSEIRSRFTVQAEKIVDSWAK